MLTWLLNLGFGGSGLGQSAIGPGGGPGNDPHYQWWMLRRRKRLNARLGLNTRKRRSNKTREDSYSPEEELALKIARRDVFVAEAARFGNPYANYGFYNTEATRRAQLVKRGRRLARVSRR